MNVVDQHVGLRLRQRREELGISGQTVADTLGISTGQLAELEAGNARLRARQMPDVCRLLEVEVGHFFDGLVLSNVTG